MVDKLGILNVVENKKTNKSDIFKWETSHQIKDCIIHEKPPRVDFIETWFQSIVGQAM
jgi:hypothetical protein